MTNFVKNFDLDPDLDAAMRAAVAEAVSEWRTLSRDRRLDNSRSLADLAVTFTPTAADGSLRPH